MSTMVFFAVNIMHRKRTTVLKMNKCCIQIIEFIRNFTPSQLSETISLYKNNCSRKITI